MFEPRTHRFDCPGPVTLSLRLAGGTAELRAEDRPDAEVEVVAADPTEASREAARNARVELHGDTLVVHAPESTGSWLWRRSGRLRVHVRMPAGSSFDVRIASADVRAYGRYASGRINAASGDTYVEHLSGDLAINTASGDVLVDRVDGDVQVRSASGDVSVGTAGHDANIHAASGDIDLGRLGGSASATTASGDINISSAASGAVRLKSASGDVSVGVAPGTGVWLDVSTTSGDAKSDLGAGDSSASAQSAALHIHARTMSGDVKIHRAAPQPA